MKNSTLRIGILLSAFCLVMACKKELSIERGGFSGAAQGELVDSLGNCKSSIVHGEYHVDSELVKTNHYALINVNFTAQGKYKIYTDTVNGMWFIDSGFAVSTGSSVVKLKGYGKPILPKTTNFIIYFNNNVCSFSVSVDGSVSGGSGGSGSGGDYFPTTVGSTWTYQYLPKLGNVDTFKVTVAPGQVTIDTLTYAQFGTSQLDTFYFAKGSHDTYYTLSSVDFDYTLLFDSIPSSFITYPFLKVNANVGDTWESGEYGTVKFGSGATAEYGKAKAVFTIFSKNTAPYTIGGKTYQNVINVNREIRFLPNGGTYRTIMTGNSYYAKGYGLIDQVIKTTPTQNISLFRTPTIF